MDLLDCGETQRNVGFHAFDALRPFNFNQLTNYNF
jgi:hypothetical protein